MATTRLNKLPNMHSCDGEVEQLQLVQHWTTCARATLLGSGHSLLMYILIQFIDVKSNTWGDISVGAFHSCHLWILPYLLLRCIWGSWFLLSCLSLWGRSRFLATLRITTSQNFAHVELFSLLDGFASLHLKLVLPSLACIGSSPSSWLQGTQILFFLVLTNFMWRWNRQVQYYYYYYLVEIWFPAMLKSWMMEILHRGVIR